MAVVAVLDLEPVDWRSSSWEAVTGRWDESILGIYIREWFLVDACLDQGGSFNYLTMSCDHTTSHPDISFFARHRGFSTFASIAGCLALIVGMLGARSKK